MQYTAKTISGFKLIRVSVSESKSVSVSSFVWYYLPNSDNWLLITVFPETRHLKPESFLRLSLSFYSCIIPQAIKTNNATTPHARMKPIASSR